MPSRGAEVFARAPKKASFRINFTFALAASRVALPRAPRFISRPLYFHAPATQTSLNGTKMLCSYASLRFYDEGNTNFHLWHLDERRLSQGARVKSTEVWVGRCHRTDRNLILLSLGKVFGLYNTCFLTHLCNKCGRSSPL